VICRPAIRSPFASWTAVVVTAVIGLAACSGGRNADTVSPSSSAPSPTTSTTTSTSTATNGGDNTSTDIASLPEIDSLRTNPTDQFLVDPNVMSGGHPYKGTSAQTPHTGAHVHFDNSANEWPVGGTGAESYPAIYAVADGIVTRVTDSFRVGSNDRYGINLAIARSGSAAYEFEYSIEPMVPEPSPGFYADFITVREGDRVAKGQIIGYMFLPPGPGGAHIHFELINTATGAFQAPAIFNKDVLKEFYARWKAFGFDSSQGYQNPIPPCMGWKIAAEENPFEAVAVECLQ
jgi:hypothetical protein